MHSIPFPWFATLIPTGGLLKLGQSELWPALNFCRLLSFNNPEVWAQFFCCVFGECCCSNEAGKWVSDCIDAESMSMALSWVESGLADRFVRTLANVRFCTVPSLRTFIIEFDCTDDNAALSLPRKLLSHDFFRLPKGEFSSDIKCWNVSRFFLRRSFSDKAEPVDASFVMDWALENGVSFFKIPWSGVGTLLRSANHERCCRWQQPTMEVSSLSCVRPSTQKLTPFLKHGGSGGLEGSQFTGLWPLML